MWGVLENVFYIIIILLFISTFLPKPIRARVRESVGALWQALPHVWRAIEPHAYRLVTGRPVPKDDDQSVIARGDLHRSVERDFPLPAAENADLHGGVEDENELVFAPATEEEIRRLALALRHNLTTQDKTKSGAIKAGWGLTRSGSDPRYARASALYDLAIKPPEPEEEFPTLIAARKEAKQLPQRRKARTT